MRQLWRTCCSCTCWSWRRSRWNIARWWWWLNSSRWLARRGKSWRGRQRWFRLRLTRDSGNFGRCNWWGYGWTSRLIRSGCWRRWPTWRGLVRWWSHSGSGVGWWRRRLRRHCWWGRSGWRDRWRLAWWWWIRWARSGSFRWCILASCKKNVPWNDYANLDCPGNSHYLLHLWCQLQVKE